MKILLVGDHRLFLEALASLIAQHLDVKAVLHAGCVADAHGLVERHADICMALLDDAGTVGGALAERVARLREAAPALKVVLLAGDARSHGVTMALRQGAAGVVLKSDSTAVLQQVLREVIAGRVVLPPWADADLLAPAPVPDDGLDLSARQRDVLRLLIDGRTNKEISRALDMSESTVKTHLSAVFRKLGVNTRTQAVVAAARLGAL